MIENQNMYTLNYFKKIKEYDQERQRSVWTDRTGKVFIKEIEFELQLGEHFRF